jgi:ABC-type lipoprotein export system ATPase subunit
VLEARGLTFGYGSDAPLFEKWDSRFEGGEVVAVTGPSGRGKSTLLYLLGLMVKPVDGEIFVDGNSVASLGDTARARLRATTFGFVFQDAALDSSRTVLDNVIEAGLYRQEPRSQLLVRARDLLEQFGVLLRADAKPGQVSGGQAQRIALCRALLGNPRILLADEPTGNLDPASADVVVDAFRAQAASGAAVVVVTHDPSLVDRCDRRVSL